MELENERRRSARRTLALAVVAVMITTATCSFAQSSPATEGIGNADLQKSATAAMAEVQETCRNWADLAGRVMQVRQDGLAQDEAMDHTLGNSTLEAIVMDAYEVQQLAQPAQRDEETLKFQNRWYMNCLLGAPNH